MAKLNNAPPWAFAVIAVLTVVILGYFGWQSFYGRDSDPGPSKKIAPGTYDLRAEAAKMRDPKGAEAPQNGR